MFDMKLIFASAIASALSLYAVSTIAAKFTVNTIPDHVKNKLRYVHHLATLHDVASRCEMTPTRELEKACATELLALYEWRSTFLMHESTELQMQVLLNFYVQKHGAKHWNKNLSQAEAEAEFKQIHNLPHFESFISAFY
jgi:hypothetical protein